jgi:hypothetical protein
MVLTAILTAIDGRLGVFAGVHWYRFLTGKDFRTPAYGSGRIAGNLQSSAQHCGHRTG